MALSFNKLGCGQDVPQTEKSPLYCQPCDANEIKVEAKKICQQCAELLCQDCCELHKKVTAVRHHVLLGISKETTYLVGSRPEVPTIKCSVHKDKIIDFFCPTHNCTACSVCTVLHHKNCHVDYIPDVAEDYQGRHEYHKLESDLKALEKEASAFNSKKDDDIEKTKDSAAQVLEEIRKHGRYLEQKEEELVQEVENLMRKDISQLQAAKDSSSTIKKEAVTMQKNLDMMRENKSDLLITCKELMSRKDNLFSTINSYKKNNHANKYAFIKGSDSFGQVKKNVEGNGGIWQSENLDNTFINPYRGGGYNDGVYPQYKYEKRKKNLKKKVIE